MSKSEDPANVSNFKHSDLYLRLNDFPPLCSARMRSNLTSTESLSRDRTLICCALTTQANTDEDGKYLEHSSKLKCRFGLFLSYGSVTYLCFASREILGKMCYTAYARSMKVIPLIRGCKDANTLLWLSATNFREYRLNTLVRSLHSIMDGGF